MKSKFIKFHGVLLFISFFTNGTTSEFVGEYFNSKRLVVTTIFACSTDGKQNYCIINFRFVDYITTFTNQST